MSSIRSILERLQTKSISNNEMTNYFEIYKANKFVVDQALKDISELIDKVKPDIKNHICRFNDGDCVCECYKAGQDEFKSNLKELLK